MLWKVRLGTRVIAHRGNCLFILVGVLGGPPVLYVLLACKSVVENTIVIVILFRNGFYDHPPCWVDCLLGLFGWDHLNERDIGHETM